MNNVLLLLLLILLIIILFYILFKPTKEETTKPSLKNTTDNTKPTLISDNNYDESPIRTEISITQIATNSSTFSNNSKTPEILNQTNNNTIKSEIKEITEFKNDEQITQKSIGYDPINIFAQDTPNSYPYVIMPKPNCGIKFPKKGRVSRKGFKEELFKSYLIKYFENKIQLFDDRYLLAKNNLKPYEPDFTIIDEKNGINIFLDVEIDEPYEGINDIEQRKVTHCKYTDAKRDFDFVTRGWIVVRFAEIQIHQQPEACCKFIAQVIKSIHPNFEIPESLNNYNKIETVSQWTEDIAKQWSSERYREKYLGIERFGEVHLAHKDIEIEISELDKLIESQIVEEFVPYNKSSLENEDITKKIESTIQSNCYISFTFENQKTIIKPLSVRDSMVYGYCYLKNIEKSFPIYSLKKLEIKKNYFTQQITGKHISDQHISHLINFAIEFNKYIRIQYNRPEWRMLVFDIEIGEMTEDITNAEVSVRTVSKVQLAINVLNQEHIERYRLDENYLTAYCHKREDKRTFKFNRISFIEILDI